mmetsp:Transcript_8298/g.12880  ORF Transcript_8298/g.12880 Transcript_8298/m.12880 type:complete len:216 (-) Transcript_8298:21-668(-)
MPTQNTITTAAARITIRVRMSAASNVSHRQCFLLRIVEQRITVLLPYIIRRRHGSITVLHEQTFDPMIHAVPPSHMCRIGPFNRVEHCTKRERLSSNTEMQRNDIVTSRQVQSKSASMIVVSQLYEFNVKRQFNHTFFGYPLHFCIVVVVVIVTAIINISIVSSLRTRYVSQVIKFDTQHQQLRQVAQYTRIQHRIAMCTMQIQTNQVVVRTNKR